MDQNMILPWKRGVAGGVCGFVIGCLVTTEVACVEGGVPTAAVGAMGGLIEGAGEQFYKNTRLLLKISKHMKDIPPGCPLK